MKSLMTKLIYAFMFLALAGFTCVLAIHLTALAGSTFLYDHLGAFVFPGLFVVWLPTIFAMNRLTKGFERKETWRVALRGCPKWMRVSCWVVFGYGWGTSMLLMLFTDARASALTSARTLSAFVLIFFVVATCVLYSATQAEKYDRTRKCTNGHQVGPLAKFCEVCGAPCDAGGSSQEVGGL